VEAASGLYINGALRFFAAERSLEIWPRFFIRGEAKKILMPSKRWSSYKYSARLQRNKA